MNSASLFSGLRHLFTIYICFLYFHGRPCSSAMVAPIFQDRFSRLYSLSVFTKSPTQATNLVLDLGASFSWVDCSRNYTSPTYHSIPCGSTLCKSLSSHVCSDCSEALSGCFNKSCFVSLQSSGKGITKALALVESLALPVTDGRNPGNLTVVPEFIFSCSSRVLFKFHHQKNTAGSAGLGQSNFSLIAQLGTAFSLPRVFALCLSGSPSAPGVAFFGTDGPYYFHPEVDLSKSLTYTPFSTNLAVAALSTNPTNPATAEFRTNPVTTTAGKTLAHLSEEYFISLSAIKVNSKLINSDPTIRAMLSTTTPYTTLPSSIYKPLVEAFVNESAAFNLSVTQPVRPFSVCFNADDVPATRLGPSVPYIDFVMQNEGVFWRIYGSNSMVRIVNGGVDVWCLGFVDGGRRTRSWIVIGGYQMVDNLLQFDLESKRLGFISALVHNTMCANFNFTVNSNL